MGRHELFKQTKLSEHAIQDQILAWLQVNGYFCWRNNTGALRVGDNRFVKFGYIGSPDILGVTRDGTGRLFGVEVKKSGGKQSLEQKTFEGHCRAFNAVYILARSLDDVLAVLPPRRAGEKWQDYAHPQQDLFNNPDRYDHPAKDSPVK